MDSGPEMLPVRQSIFIERKICGTVPRHVKSRCFRKQQEHRKKCNALQQKRAERPTSATQKT
jgi:hypothetical protein